VFRGPSGEHAAASDPGDDGEARRQRPTGVVAVVGRTGPGPIVSGTA